MDIDRFWSKVDKTGDCWIWHGPRNAGGYGLCSWGLVHRVSYTLLRGAIPAGLVLMHSCDNRRCCNPDHLTPGTHAENMADMVRKGRHGRRSGGPWTMPTGFSIPKHREEEVEQALRKMKILRPFDSFSTIIVDAIVGQAAAMDSEGLYQLYTSQHRSGENGGTPG